RKEALPDVVVPMGPRPAAVGEPAVAVLVRPSRRLDDAVQRDEFRDDQLSHDARSFQAFAGTSNETLGNRQRRRLPSARALATPPSLTAHGASVVEPHAWRPLAWRSARCC